jgi:uncharacterized membrane protein (DUF106 family)
MTSIFFCAGLGLGFTLGLVTWAVCSWLGKKLAEQEIKSRNAKAVMESQLLKQKRDEALNKLKAANPEMTERQQKLMEDELATVFQRRERSQI